MSSLPVHARAFEASFDDILVGTFDHTTANRPALLDEVGIVHLRLAFFEISEIDPQQFMVRLASLMLT